MRFMATQLKKLVSDQKRLLARQFNPDCATAPNAEKRYQTANSALDELDRVSVRDLNVALQNPRLWIGALESELESLKAQLEKTRVELINARMLKSEAQNDEADVRQLLTVEERDNLLAAARRRSNEAALKYYARIQVLSGRPVSAVARDFNLKEDAIRCDIEAYEKTRKQVRA